MDTLYWKFSIVEEGACSADTPAEGSRSIMIPHHLARPMFRRNSLHDYMFFLKSDKKLNNSKPFLIPGGSKKNDFDFPLRWWGLASSLSNPVAAGSTVVSVCAVILVLYYLKCVCRITHECVCSRVTFQAVRLPPLRSRRRWTRVNVNSPFEGPCWYDSEAQQVWATLWGDNSAGMVYRSWNMPTDSPSVGSLCHTAIQRARKKSGCSFYASGGRRFLWTPSPTPPLSYQCPPLQSLSYPEL